MKEFIKFLKSQLYIAIFISSAKLSSFVMEIRTLESLIFLLTHPQINQQKLTQIPYNIYSNLQSLDFLAYIYYSNLYVIIFLQQLMSHLNIKRRRTQSLKSKLYSQQSKVLAPRQSIGRILNDSLSKRRATTHNSPDPSQNTHAMEAELEQAKQVYKNKNTKSALVMFKKLYKKYPKNMEIPYFVGSCLLNQSNFELALGYFKVCLTFDTIANKNVYIYMAICYKALHQTKQAVDILSAACEKYPRFKDAYFYKGKIHLKQQQFNEAINCFRRCLKIEPTDELSKLFLADSLKNISHYDEAIQKYDALIRDSQKYSSKALTKKIYVLLQSKRIKQASIELKKAAINNTESIELTFLKGMCEYQLGNYSESSTFLQLSLVSNIAEPHLGKALKLLLQIKIKQKDFLGAQHLISRSKFANTKQDEMLLYYKLVEGINDLIKRRLNQCQQKLEKVYTNSTKQLTDQQKFLYETSSSFYAYCQFSLQKYDSALQIYKKCKTKKDPIKKIEQYNLLICEGIVCHKKGQFFPAQQKFKLAGKLINSKVQPIFLICVNYVQQNRDNFDKQEIKKKVFERLDKEFRMAEKIQPPNPLFLFYESLTLLFQGKDACPTIQKAIQASEQQISQYFFIQGLAYSISGQTLKGLQSINKAIELDHNIPQFYKERSKYYYVLERFDQAVTDISNILADSDDEQAKLLMTFYYYMTSEYALALDILRQVSQHCTQDKFKQFQMALNFRLHNYQKCGITGTILTSIISKQKLPDKTIQQIIQTHINSRQIYSQFNIYFFHLLLSAYYFYRTDYDTCLQHLFGTLQQIQLSTQNQQCQSPITELMINQIKYNITLTSLIKEEKNCGEGQSRNYSDTAKYVEMFMNQTEDLDFIKVMNSILEMMEFQENDKKSKQNNYIELYTSIPKVSDDLPELTIHFNRGFTMKTKFIIIYPQKLKFNICPEFDESFLFNFDVDKIQSKLCPPWFKLHEGQIIFTDQIRNQSVLISQTDKAPTPSLLSPSPHPQNLRQKFKLDEAVQKKLQRIIKIKKASSKNMANI